MRRTSWLTIAIAALAVVGTLAPAADAGLRKARSLGPTPVQGDCLTYRGPNPCYYGLWSGRFELDKHLLNIGDVVTATIQTYGGYNPIYVWAEPGGPGLVDIKTEVVEPGKDGKPPSTKLAGCPGTAPPGPAAGPPNYWLMTCSFRANHATGGWQIIAPTMGLAISPYPDGDYYAIISGASVSGRVVNGKGEGVAGVRITITGPNDLYATTDAEGFYNAIDLKPGTYTIAVASKRTCLDLGVAISAKTCKRSVKKSVHGNVEVNFKNLGSYGIFGKARDEYGNPLVGVEIVASGLPGGETISLKTALDGSYRLGLDDASTVTLTSTKGYYEYAFYYVVKADGKPSTGTAADVTPNAKTPNVKVDWEVDRRLHFLTTANADLHAPGDGFSKKLVKVGVITQHGNPIKNVTVAFSVNSGSVPSVVCTTDDRLKWPTLFSDGRIDTIGGFEATTDAKGEIWFQLFPGTVGGWFAYTVAKKGDASQTVQTGIYVDMLPGTAFGSGTDASRALTDGGLLSAGALPSPEAILEWWAARRGLFPKKAGVDLAIVKSGGSRAVAIFPRTLGPTINSAGLVTPNGQAYIVTSQTFHEIAGVTTLPTLEEWAQGQPVTVDRSDPRTYGGYPLPVRYAGGLGTCLDGATGGMSLITTHSPANVLLTDPAGKRLGRLPNGKAIAEGVDGIVYDDGEAIAIIAPSAAYRASVVGTGNGPVAIESDTPSGTATLRFDARKGKGATAKLASGAGLTNLVYNRKRVRATAGSQMRVSVFPKRWTAYRSIGPIDPATTFVTGLSGEPIPYATITINAANGEEAVLTADRTGSLHGFWPALLKGRRTFTIRAAGYAPTPVTVNVLRR